jgi:antitoxin CcdA
MRIFMAVLSRGAAMPRPASSISPRRATNVTLPEALLRDARDMGINLSQACERGLAAAVADSRRERWIKENREAMDAWNEHVAQHGLPLAAYRQF